MFLILLSALAASVSLNVLFLLKSLTKQRVCTDASILRSRLTEIRSTLGLAATSVHTDVLSAIKKLQGKS